jgi:hypothetical protein
LAKVGLVEDPSRAWEAQLSAHHIGLKMWQKNVANYGK